MAFSKSRHDTLGTEEVGAMDSCREGLLAHIYGSSVRVSGDTLERRETSVLRDGERAFWKV